MIGASSFACRDWLLGGFFKTEANKYNEQKWHSKRISNSTHTRRDSIWSSSTNEATTSITCESTAWSMGSGERSSGAKGYG